MELTLWTYEGPPHVGAMRIAASMEGVHYVLHAPQGDTYADLLFTMIERRDRRPPVTYTTFQARDLGGDTAELVKRSIAAAVERFRTSRRSARRSAAARRAQARSDSLACRGPAAAGESARPKPAWFPLPRRCGRDQPVAGWLRH